MTVAQGSRANRRGEGTTLNAADGGWLHRHERPEGVALVAGGRWDIGSAGRLHGELLQLAPQLAGVRTVTVDVTAVQALDTAGAWLLHRTVGALRAGGVEVAVRGAQPQHEAMLTQIAQSYRPCATEPPRGSPFAEMIERFGRACVRVSGISLGFIAFFGQALVAALYLLRHPGRLRLASTVFHMEQVGINALPIVTLISFLIGVVMAYQGAAQLQRFGAEVFVVNLLAVSILRELGIMLTAIVVAGRSGSAFTAQIGSMNVHEEVDALRALGLSPMEVLVLPRLVALVVMMPLLAFAADMAGLAGGGLVCWLGLGVGPAVFLERLHTAVSVSGFWVGIVKAPIFGLLVGLVGCYEGMQVARSAESVGEHTTRSVVVSIFLVIVADAFFSIVFDVLGF